jgi:hypothetical protein
LLRRRTHCQASMLLFVLVLVRCLGEWLLSDRVDVLVSQGVYVFGQLKWIGMSAT